ncbi:MAG: hypothetical protein PHQ98_00140 [Candidatus ainarchaeum sp.]|nr:hypothetical protein [Candidatus ainarchaeum sp.]
MDRFKNLELIKFPKFDEPDTLELIKTFERFFSKSTNDSSCKLSLSLKDYAKGGLRKQHEIHAKLICDGKSYFASETSWNLVECIKKVTSTLEKEAKKQSK